MTVNIHKEIDEKYTGINSIRVNIGEVVCNIVCDNSDELENLRVLYGDFITETPYDVTLELKISEGIGDNPSSVMAADHSTEDNYLSAHIEKNPNDGRVYSTLLNRMLYRAYYTSDRMRLYSGEIKPLLIHACGVLLDGKAVLFIGPSKAGKTTVARMLSETEAEVINDEMLVISRNDRTGNPFLVQGAPIIGDYIGRLNAVAPLDSVMILKKSPRTAIYPIDRTEAYTRFLRQIITPSYIGQTDSKAVLATMADFTGELTSLVPFYVLEFNLNIDSLWDEINKMKIIARNR